MFAPPVAKPNAKSDATSNNEAAIQRPTPVGHRFGESSVEQAPMLRRGPSLGDGGAEQMRLLQRRFGNQAVLRFLRQGGLPHGAIGVEQMRMLQSTIGNQAVLRLLAQRASVTRNEPGAQEKESDIAGAAAQAAAPSPLPAPHLPAPLQAKLKVGAVNDPLEQEADSVAEQVMRMPAPEVGVTAAPPNISRKCAECNEDEKLQKKEAGTAEAAAGEAPGIVHEVLQSPGQPLDASSQAYLEPRFGHDFSGVRVHTDARAAESAKAVNALAYTLGRDVVFGAGQYAPQSFSGRRLIAHELMHVVQQAGATKSLLDLQREPDKKPKRRDVVVIGEDWKGSEELALALAPGALVVRVKSMGDVVMKLAKVNFPVGTLYVITHSAPTGELQFGTAEGTIKPADIAGKLKGALSADSAPDIVDFRGCSVGTSPKAMDQIGAALGAKSVIAGDCFAVIARSNPVSINGKAITRASEVAEKAADDDKNKKRRDLFVDLLRKNADTFRGEKKCIVNPGESGYFAAGGHFVALWFNRDDTAAWVPDKSVCYKDVAPETVDPSKALAASDHCRLIRVEKKAASKD